jgi:DNA-binding NarL/FixJ family response regulator
MKSMLAASPAAARNALIRAIAEANQRESQAAERRNRLLEEAERVGGLGIWEWSPDTGETVWSDNLFRIFGFEPGEITPSVDFVLERTHPQDRARLKRQVARLAQGSLLPISYRIVREVPEHQIRHLRSTMAVVAEDDVRGKRLIGVVQDVTDRLWAEHEIAAHVAVAEALTEWDGFETGATRLLERLAEAMGFDVGVLWLPDGDVLAARVQWSATADYPEFEAVTRKLRFPRGCGLPGKAWQELVPIALRSLEDVRNPRRQSSAAQAGLRGALALPVVHRMEVLGVLEFYSREEVEMTERLLRSLTGISHEIGQLFDRRRGEIAPSRLTPRQLEVLQLAALGLSGPGIAERLMVSPATVKTHFEHIYEKLGASDRSSAVATAVRTGLID